MYVSNSCLLAGPPFTGLQHNSSTMAFSWGYEPLSPEIHEDGSALLLAPRPFSCCIRRSAPPFPLQADHLPTVRHDGQERNELHHFCGDLRETPHRPPEQRLAPRAELRDFSTASRVRKDSCKYTLQDGFVNRRPMLRGEESSRDFTCAPSKLGKKKLEMTIKTG